VLGGGGEGWGKFEYSGTVHLLCVKFKKASDSVRVNYFFLYCAWPVFSPWPSHCQGAETVEFLQSEDVTATAMQLFRVLKNPMLNSV
jgi:hypothetical protein